MAKKIVIPTPKNISFLHLEDMSSIRMKLKSDLKALGFTGKIFEAANIKEAIKLCNQEKFDFIISDWNLPDGTGFSFLKKLKATNKFKNIPFLMCTTVDEVEHIISAINEGANEYLVKPWEEADLQEKLDYCWTATHLPKN